MIPYNNVSYVVKTIPTNSTGEEILIDNHGRKWIKELYQSCVDGCVTGRKTATLIDNKFIKD